MRWKLKDTSSDKEPSAKIVQQPSTVSNYYLICFLTKEAVIQFRINHFRFNSRSITFIRHDSLLSSTSSIVLECHVYN